MRLADALVGHLADRGWTKMFGVTGRGSLYLSDAVAREPRMEFTPVMHEQTAGFAAMGFTAATGVPSVCLLSSGVGSTNAITPLLCAWQDQLPVVFISGQNFSHSASALNPTTKRTYGEQELNLGPLVESLTKSFLVVDSPSSFGDSFTSALRALTDGRPGPVWIDVPLDFQSSRVTALTYPADSRHVSGTVEGSQTRRLKLELRAANRPVILLGPSLNLHPEKMLILKALDDLDLPVVYEAGAESLFPRYKRNSIGPVGSMGCDPRAIAVLESADVVVGIGALLRSSLTGINAANFLPGATFLIFDYDAYEIPASLLGRAHFMGDSAIGGLALLKNEQFRYRDWNQSCQQMKRDSREQTLPGNHGPGLDLHSLAVVLCGAADDDAIFLTDSGFCEVILPTNCSLTEGQKWLHPFSQGSMGYGTGAALGASHAFPSKQVILVVGDGSLMMNPQDLHTISSGGHNIKIVLMDNDMYGIIRLRQRDLFRGRLIGVDQGSGVQSPRWQEMVEGFGIRFVDLPEHSVDEESLGLLFAAPGPAVIRIEGAQSQNYWVAGGAGQSGPRAASAEPNPFLEFQEQELSRSLSLLGSSWAELRNQ